MTGSDPEASSAEAGETPAMSEHRSVSGPVIQAGSVSVNLPSFSPRSTELLLLKSATELDEVVAFARGAELDTRGPVFWLANVKSSNLGEQPRDIAKRWCSVFSDEITTVQLTRNSLVHNRPISSQDIERALELANRILRIIRSSAESAPPSSQMGQGAEGLRRESEDDEGAVAESGVDEDLAKRVLRLTDLERYQEALGHLRRAIEKEYSGSPEQASDLLELLSGLAAAGKLDEAIQIIQRELSWAGKAAYEFPIMPRRYRDIPEL